MLFALFDDVLTGTGVKLTAPEADCCVCDAFFVFAIYGLILIEVSSSSPRIWMGLGCVLIGVAVMTIPARK